MPSNRDTSFIRWFFIEQPRRNRVGFVLPIITAIVSGVWWSSDVSKAQQVSLQTMTARMEKTRQEYKGLEAFLLSDVDGIVGNLSGARVTPEFEGKFKEFQDAVNAAILKQPAQVTIKVERDPRAQGYSLGDKYITDSDDKTSSSQAPVKNGFLFFPAMMLAPDVAAGEQVDDKTIIAAALREGRPLKAQLFAAQEIDPQLKGLADIEAFYAQGLTLEPKPVQCYYLTSAGVIRLYSSNLSAGQEQVRYYKNQFKPTTFFPDRPYFWPTIKEYTRNPAETNHTVQSVFHQTRPYLDLGGNGVVVTLSIGVKATGIHSGLFLDFTLGDSAKERIKDKIRNIGGFAAETSWVLGEDGSAERIKTGDELSNKREAMCKAEFKQAYDTRKADESLSDLFGDIYVFKHGPPGDITFTVPLGRPRSDQRERAITFLYCELEPKAFQIWGSLKLLIFALSVAVLVGFIAWAQREHKLKLREYDLKLAQHKEFLDKVAQLMSEAPVPYCRLDKDKQFVEINEAFASMLGYKSKEEAEKELIRSNKKWVWEELLDEKSCTKYKNEIEPRRRNRQPTAPYHVRMRRPEGKWVDVTVHGADVPGEQGQFPETFGVLLREGSVLVLESEEMVVKPFYNPPRKSAASAASHRRLTLFVLMPFREHIDSVFDKHIMNVANTLDLALTRADKIVADVGFVMIKTWEAICAADAIVVDCSGLNPNVFYELGLAHVVKGKKVVLIGQERPEDLPFNIKSMEYIRYTAQSIESFEPKLEKKLRAVLSDPKE